MEITSRGIRHGDDFVPMHAISSVDLRTTSRTERTERSRKSQKQSWLFLGIGGALYVPLSITSHLFGIPSLHLPTGILVILGFIALQSRSAMQKTPIYALQVVTNTGRHSLFTNTDKQFLKEVQEAIIGAMEHGSAVNIQVNNDNRQITDNSTNTVHITYDFSYNISHHAAHVADEQLEAVRQSLDDLTAAISPSDDGTLKAQLETLVQELSKETPKRSILEQSWSRLKSACEIAGMGQTVAAAGQAIWPFIVAITG